MSQAFDELRHTVARLRGPGGCPWDQEQTHESLVRCLIDEVSELIETIDQADMPHMREELGDVLLQVVFHAQLAEEAGHFDLDAVARELNEKLIRRHPHVFGAADADGATGGDGPVIDSSEKVLTQWEAIKAQEKAARQNEAGGSSPDAASGTAAGQRALAEPLFKSLPPRLPALLFAENVWKQCRKKELGTRPSVDREAVSTRAAELTEAELGRALFELSAAAQQAGLNPEDALRRWTNRLIAEAETRARTPRR